MPSRDICSHVSKTALSAFSPNSPKDYGAQQRQQPPDKLHIFHLYLFLPTDAPPRRGASPSSWCTIGLGSGKSASRCTFRKRRRWRRSWTTCELPVSLRQGKYTSLLLSVEHQLIFASSLANVPFRLNSSDGAFHRNRIQRTRISSSSPVSNNFGNETQASGICLAS